MRSSETPCRRNASRAPTSSRSVMKSLNRATTMPKRLFSAVSVPRNSAILVQPEQVAELGLLHAQVLHVALGRLGHEGHALDDFQPEGLETNALGRVVREEPHL